MIVRLLGTTNLCELIPEKLVMVKQHTVGKLVLHNVFAYHQHAVQSFPRKSLKCDTEIIEAY